mgnify:CR=1 FL=1
MGCNEKPPYEFREDYVDFIVNGRAWNPQSGPLCSDFSTDYYEEAYKETPAGYLTFSTKNCPNKLTLIIALQNVFGPKVFDLRTDSSVANVVFRDYGEVFSLSGGRYDSLLAGNLKIVAFKKRSLTPHVDDKGDTITNVDPGWVEGTFDNIMLISKGGGDTARINKDTIKITGGRFGIFFN